MKRLRSRRGVLTLTFAFSVLLIVFLCTLAALSALSLAATQSEQAIVGTQALYAAEAGLAVARQSGRSDPLVGTVGRGRYAVQELGGRLVAMGEAERALGKPLRRVVAVRRGGGNWTENPPALYPQLSALLDREADTR